MADTICLTTLLKQADTDLLAAQLEYADTVSRISLSEEEKRVLYSLHLGTMTLDDADAALPDSSRAVTVYRARNRFDSISSQVKQFKENPPAVEYKNADFAIPQRFYDEAHMIQHPPQIAPEVPKLEPKRKPIRRDVVGYLLAVFILAVLLVLAALNNGGLRSDVEELQLQNEEQYHDGYNEGEAIGLDSGYSNGYDAGYSEGQSATKDAWYAQGYEEGRQYGYGEACGEFEAESEFYHDTLPHSRILRTAMQTARTLRRSAASEQFPVPA